MRNQIGSLWVLVTFAWPRMSQQLQIHVVDFDEQELEVQSLIYGHKHEIRSLCPCPYREDLIVTGYQKRNTGVGGGVSVKQGVTLWKFNDLKFPEKKVRQSTVRKTNPTLQPLWSIEDLSYSPVESVLWEPASSSTSVAGGMTTTATERLAVIDHSQLRLYTLSDKASQIQPSTSIPAPTSAGQDSRFGIGVWNPHNRQEIAVSSGGTTVHVYDLRSAGASNATPSIAVAKANSINIRSLAYNPNKANYMAVAGDDCCLRMFDMRNCGKALLTSREHSHWVWSIAFNPFHDQLILTGGSDERVTLINVQSIYESGKSNIINNENIKQSNNNPAVPLPPRQNNITGKLLDDGLLEDFEQHDDSVYSVCWSAADPWVFASVSYDGRVVMNNVSDEPKTKVMQI